MAKSSKKLRMRDDTVRIVAAIHGVSISYVKKVRNGERENEDIMATLIDYQAGKNQLIKALEEMVSLTPQPEKYARG